MLSSSSNPTDSDERLNQEGTHTRTAMSRNKHSVRRIPGTIISNEEYMEDMRRISHRQHRLNEISQLDLLVLLCDVTDKYPQFQNLRFQRGAILALHHAVNEYLQEYNESTMDPEAADSCLSSADT